MTVLVAGAAGFIGSHLVNRLLADGRPNPRYGNGTSERDYTCEDDLSS